MDTDLTVDANDLLDNGDKVDGPDDDIRDADDAEVDNGNNDDADDADDDVVDVRDFDGCAMMSDDAFERIAGGFVVFVDDTDDAYTKDGGDDCCSFLTILVCNRG